MSSKHKKNPSMSSELSEINNANKRGCCKFLYDRNSKAFNIEKLSDYDRFSRDCLIPIDKMKRMVGSLNESLAASSVLDPNSVDAIFDTRVMIYIKISALFMLAFIILVITDVYYIQEPALTYIGTACLIVGLVIQLVIMLFNADFRSKKTKATQLPNEQIKELRSIVYQFTSYKSKTLKRYDITVTLSQNCLDLLFKANIN